MNSKAITIYYPRQWTNQALQDYRQLHDVISSHGKKVQEIYDGDYIAAWAYQDDVLDGVGDGFDSEIYSSLQELLDEDGNSTVSELKDTLEHSDALIGASAANPDDDDAFQQALISMLDD